MQLMFRCFFILIRSCIIPDGVRVAPGALQSEVDEANERANFFEGQWNGVSAELRDQVTANRSLEVEKARLEAANLALSERIDELDQKTMGLMQRNSEICVYNMELERTLMAKEKWLKESNETAED